MFYQGTLQEGISIAVGQQKLVLCFVTDDGNESRQWEDEFLADESLHGTIKEHAVALRLVAGSEEAGYLAQIFPLPRTPTVVIIKNGELKEYITPGTSKGDFVQRVQNAFSTSSQASSSAAAAQPAPASMSTTQAESEAAPAAAPQNSPLPATATEPERSDNVRRILAERTARLQAQKEEAERKAKEGRAKAKEKAKAEAKAGADTDAARTHKQAEALKKRRLQEKEERQRILKRIEDDKAERRMRAAEREQQRIGNLKGGDVAAALVAAPESKLPSATRTSEMTALQVRLFDGSTLRSRFRTRSSLMEVRQWVDENRHDGNSPFSFKQVLTPLPNKTIDVTEEDQSLGALGLSPSSTLVLVPVQSHASAYAGGSQDIVSRLLGIILRFFAWFFGLFGLGGGRPQEPEMPSSSEVSRDNSRSSSQVRQRRIRGFENPNDRQRDQQLYNGNSLNFESRPDEDEN